MCSMVSYKATYKFIYATVGTIFFCRLGVIKGYLTCSPSSLKPDSNVLVAIRDEAMNYCYTRFIKRNVVVKQAALHSRSA